MVGEELLLYDRDSHTAHCLSPIAASVWRHCDGKRDETELAGLTGVSENLVADALYELRDKDLLDAEPQLMQSTVPGISRREAIVRVARYGAAAAAGSMVVSVTAATPAMAASGKKCVSKPGSTESCCRCQNGQCVNEPKGTESTCESFCKKVSSSLEFFAVEAECQ